jgi:cystathionine beta-lyase
MVSLNERKLALATAGNNTRHTHLPIIEVEAKEINPQRREAQTTAPFSSATVLFQSVSEWYQYSRAPALGMRDYGIVGSEESVALEEKINALYEGKGAKVHPSGLASVIAAIKTVYHQKIMEKDEPFAVLLPNFVYGPVERFFKEPEYRDLKILRYGPSKNSFNRALHLANELDIRVGLIYIETPVSNTFDVHDLELLANRAKRLGAYTIADNTFSTAQGCNPLKYGIDIVVEAGTKYLSGYGDLAYGVAVCSTGELAELLAEKTRNNALGTLGLALADVAYHRIDAAPERVRKSHENAKALIEGVYQPLQRAKVVKDLFFYDPETSGTAKTRAQQTSGNGLLGVLLNPRIDEGTRDLLLNSLCFAWLGASWGSEPTLVIPRDHGGKHGFRCHAGHGEDDVDLVKDHRQALVIAAQRTPEKLRRTILALAA